MKKFDQFKIVDEAHKALKELRESQEFTPSPSARSRFDEQAFYEKLKNDALFFESVYDELVGKEDLKEAYNQIVTEAVLLAHDLLKEADVPPKIIAPTVEYSSTPLSESEVITAYKRAFNLILENEFNKPNLRGELLQEDLEVPLEEGMVCDKMVQKAPGAVKVILRCVQDGSLDGNDPEAAVKYGFAEQAIIDAIRQVLMPRNTFQAVQNYIQNQDPDYQNVFGNDLQQNLDKFNGRCQVLGSFLAPFIFKRALANAGVDVPFAPGKLAGITGAGIQNAN